LMAQIEGQIRETHGMIYTGLDKTWKVLDGRIEFLKNEMDKQSKALLPWRLSR
jgi:hypothetical protein